MADIRLNRPSGPIWWKYFIETTYFFDISYVLPVYTLNLLFSNSNNTENIHRLNTVMVTWFFSPFFLLNIKKGVCKTATAIPGLLKKYHMSYDLVTLCLSLQWEDLIRMARRGLTYIQIFEKTNLWLRENCSLEDNLLKHNWILPWEHWKGVI